MPNPEKKASEAALNLYKPPKDAPLADVPSPELIIQQAVQKGHTGAELKDLLEFAREVRKDRAEQAFTVAFNQFQAECPKVLHNRTAKIASGGGAGFNYTYPDTEHIRKIVDPHLRKHGFTLRFGDMRIEGQGDQMLIAETAILSHVGGHSWQSTFYCAVKKPSPAMTPQQAFGNASTYAQRRAMCKLLGLATGEDDTDGAGAGPPAEPLTKDQVTEIDRLVKETGTDWSKFYAWLGVAALKEVTSDRYESIIRELNRKRTRR